MAEIIQEEKHEGGKRKPKKHAPHIDMTPMVDLMCLLITFFMLTTAFSKPKIMEIILPEKIQKNDPNYKPPKIPESRTVNIILGPENKIYYYSGRVSDPKNPPPLQETDFSANGIRKLLLDRNTALFRKIKQFTDDVTAGKIIIKRDSVPKAVSKLKTDDDTGPIVRIMAYKKANYGNFVNILDEMSIIGIARYTFVDISLIEEIMIETTLGITPTSPKKK
jgi:biopolymer transport protein ExbD